MRSKVFVPRHWFFIVGIVVLAALLRLPFLYDAPVFGDESQYLFRSAGWIDTFLSDVQTTPLDWFQDPPWWTRISFHDHPPLGFTVFHFFSLVFGPTLWAGRFASVVFGLASIPLIFFIGKRLFSERAGLIAAGLFAVNSFAILYHRAIMLESTLVFFVLLGLYFFVRAREEKKFWPIWGLVFGASVLTKYTAIALLPMFTLILWRDLRQNRITKGALLSALATCGFAILPIIIYNIMLFKTVGHFDLQLSFLFGQETKEWVDLVGKDQRGTLVERLIGWRQFAELTSPVFVFVSVFSLLATLFFLARKKSADDEWFGLVTILTVLSSFAFLTLATGSASRFLFPVVPFLCLLIGWSTEKLWQEKRERQPALIFIVCLILGYEAVYSVNSHLLSRVRAPMGRATIAYAERLVIRHDPLQTLDRALEERLSSSAPAVIADLNHPILNDVIDRFAQKRAGKKDKSEPVILIVDPRIPLPLYHWNFLRRTLFEGWPAVSTDRLPDFLARTAGDEIQYRFLFALPDEKDTYRGRDSGSSLHPDTLVELLETGGVVPSEFFSSDKARVFRLYEFFREDISTTLQLPPS